MLKIAESYAFRGHLFSSQSRIFLTFAFLFILYIIFKLKMQLKQIFTSHKFIGFGGPHSAPSVIDILNIYVLLYYSKE